MSIIDNKVDSFFNQDVAVEGIYTPDGGQPSTTQVIFDRNYYEAATIGESSVESNEIIITVKTSDYDGCKQGETVVIAGITYYIINPRMDVGISEIELSKNPP